MSNNEKFGVLMLALHLIIVTAIILMYPVHFLAGMVIITGIHLKQMIRDA